MNSQCGELAHVGEGIIRQGVDFIVAQITGKAKVSFSQYTHRVLQRSHCTTHTDANTLAHVL